MLWGVDRFAPRKASVSAERTKDARDRTINFAVEYPEDAARDHYSFRPTQVDADPGFPSSNVHSKIFIVARLAGTQPIEIRLNRDRMTYRPSPRIRFSDSAQRRRSLGNRVRNRVEFLSSAWETARWTSVRIGPTWATTGSHLHRNKAEPRPHDVTACRHVPDFQTRPNEVDRQE